MGSTTATRISLFSVSVVIAWTKDGGQRQVELTSDRIGLAPAAHP
jgi:hypothetical protein